MTADDAKGVLAIWNDIRPERVADFEFWYKNEHFPERLGVPGFRLGRRYEALSDGLGDSSAVATAPRYFCYYLTYTPETLTSPAYLARLNAPTDLTRSMMSDAFRNMSRTACRRVLRRGALLGAICVTARFTQAIDAGAADAMLAKLAAEDGVARGELWATVEQPGAAPAQEEKLRGGDRKIAACLMVDTLRPADAERVAQQLQATYGSTAEIGLYRLVCEMAAQA